MIDSAAQLRDRILALESQLAMMRAHRDALMIQADKLRDEIDTLRRASIEKAMYDSEG
jgi:cell division protein FtsB